MIQHGCLIRCGKRDQLRRKDPLAVYGAGFEFFQEPLIVHLFMGRMLIHIIQIVAILGDPVGVEDLSDDFYIRAGLL